MLNRRHLLASIPSVALGLVPSIASAAPETFKVRHEMQSVPSGEPYFPPNLTAHLIWPNRPKELHPLKLVRTAKGFTTEIPCGQRVWIKWSYDQYFTGPLGRSSCEMSRTEEYDYVPGRDASKAANWKLVEISDVNGPRPYLEDTRFHGKG